MARLGRSWRLGAAFVAASGTPFTRLDQGAVSCGPSLRDACRWSAPPTAESPGAERNEGYRRLDLLASWGRSFRKWEISAFLQVHNALNWENTGAYTDSHSVEYLSPSGTRTEVYDNFLPGAPILPVVGLRVAF